MCDCPFAYGTACLLRDGLPKDFKLTCRWTEDDYTLAILLKNKGVGIGCDAFVKKSEEPKEKKPRGKKSKRGALDESQIKL